MPQQSLVLLVEHKGARNQGHTKALVDAGFRVESVASEEANIARVLARRPAVVAAELDGHGALAALDLARRFRENPRARLIPFIIYGHHLRARDIEDAARAGALWLQLEPADGARLVAAVRGVIAASLRENVAADEPRGRSENRA